jgi:hypothetical protein
MLPADVAAQGSCTKPELLPLVDAAFNRQGSPAQRHLETVVCPQCPIWRECLGDAVEHGEYGPWGGTSQRTRRRYVRTHRNLNMRDVVHPPTAGHLRDQPTNGSRTDRTVGLLADLGVSASEVKRWGVEEGLASGLRGRPSSELIEQYAAAHADV